MARLSIEQVEMRYPSSSTERPPYLSIQGERETKQVRFLYNTINVVTTIHIVQNITTNIIFDLVVLNISCLLSYILSSFRFHCF